MEEFRGDHHTETIASSDPFADQPFMILFVGFQVLNHKVERIQVARKCYFYAFTLFHTINNGSEVRDLVSSPGAVQENHVWLLVL